MKLAIILITLLVLALFTACQQAIKQTPLVKVSPQIMTQSVNQEKADSLIEDVSVSTKELSNDLTDLKIVETTSVDEDLSEINNLELGEE